MRRARFSIAIAATLALTALTAAPPPAGATAESGECRYVAHPPAGPRGNVLLITLNQTIGIRRDGGLIGVYERAGQGAEVDCAGRQATTHSIDRIEFRPPGASHELVIDESNGRFEPGASQEAGGDEIEIVAVFPRRRGRAILRPGVRLIGTPGPDQMRIGRHKREMTAINVAVGRDGRHQDPDVFAYSFWPAHYTLDGRGGDDRIGSSGNGPELDGPLPERGVYLRAGDGRDRVFAGPRRDQIQAIDGGDLIYARGGDDSIQVAEGGNRVIAARGADRIVALPRGSGDAAESFYSGGPGKDSIRAYNGQVDSIGCGSGIDHVWVDPTDLWDRGTCEHPHGPDFD